MYCVLRVGLSSTFVKRCILGLGKLLNKIWMFDKIVMYPCHKCTQEIIETDQNIAIFIYSAMHCLL